MCGVIGSVNSSMPLDKAISSINHRGPDSFGQERFDVNGKNGMTKKKGVFFFPRHNVSVPLAMNTNLQKQRVMISSFFLTGKKNIS